MLNSIFANTGPVVTLIILIFVCVVTALWLLLPLAVFGIKNRLDTLIMLQSKTNKIIDSTIKNKDI